MKAKLRAIVENDFIDVELENDVLLPCPFCGSTNLELAHTHTPSYWVECPDCNAQVGDNESWSENTEQSHLESAKRAIQAWNRRV